MGQFEMQQSHQGIAPPPIPNTSYHVVQNGQATGPFDMGVLSQMANAGTLTKDSLVWKQGMEDWVRAETVQELLLLFGSAVKSIPPVLPQELEV